MPTNQPRRSLLSRRTAIHAAVAVGMLAASAVVHDNTSTTQTTATPAATSPTVWTTVVNDQFNSGGLPTHWHSYNGRYGSGADHNCARPAQSTVSGGYLHLQMVYDPNPLAGKCGAAWYTAGLSLDRALSAVNQRITTRFRVLQTGGIQAHRIIPMLSADDNSGRGEQDYCESTPVTFCSTFLHWFDEVGRERMKYAYDLTAWHTTVVTRDGYHVTTFLDGVAKMDFHGDELSLPSNLKHVVLQQECNKLGCPLTQDGGEDIQISYIIVENGS